VDVTSTARSSQEVVSSVKGGTRVTMIDLHRLSSSSPTHSTPTPTLPPSTPPPRRCYPRGLSRHCVPQDRPPPPLAICFAQSPRKQCDVTRYPPPALSTPAARKKIKLLTTCREDWQPTPEWQIDSEWQSFRRSFCVISIPLYKIHAFRWYRIIIYTFI